MGVVVYNHEFVHNHLHYITILINWNIHLCIFSRMGFIKMILDEIDERYYINVCDLMKSILPRPKHKTKFIVNYDEILPIITVECGI